MKKLRILCIVSLLAALLASCAGPDGTEPAESSTDTTAETVEAGESADTATESETIAETSTDTAGEAESETLLPVVTASSDPDFTPPSPWEGEYTSEVRPELILDTTVYNADSDPTIGWTVVAAEPGKALNCTIDGWLYRVEGDEKVPLGCVSQAIGLTQVPASSDAYASYHTSACIHEFLLLEQQPPFSLEAGEYLLEYRNDRDHALASAMFTVTETVTCSHELG